MGELYYEVELRAACICRGDGTHPSFLAIAMMLFRVMPGRMVSPEGGVLIVLPFTTNTLQEDTSSTYLSCTLSRYITSA